MSKLLVIIGITGNQGGSVADAFLPDKSWRIRAITRDPTKASAQEWASKGVELVQGDMDDIPSLTRAFTGATAIFAMTDYWYPLFDPKVRSKATQKNIIPNKLCAEIETTRGKNLALAASSPEVQRTLQRYIYSSLPNCTKLSNGKYTKMWHFDSKAAVEEWILNDAAMQTSGLSAKASFIHVGLYMDNWKRGPLELRKDSETGGYYHIDITDGRSPAPFVYTRRDTGPLVKALVEDLVPGTILAAVSHMANYREFMRTWANVTGRRLAGDEGIKRVSEEEARAAIPGDEHFKDHILECYLFGRDCGGYFGGDGKILMPSDVGLQDKMTKLEEFFKREDWSALE